MQSETKIEIKTKGHNLLITYMFEINFCEVYNVGASQCHLDKPIMDNSSLFSLSIFQGNSESSEVGYMGMATYNLRKINNFIKEVNLKKNIFLN